MPATIPHCSESQRRRLLVDRINGGGRLNGIEHIELMGKSGSGQRLRLNLFAGIDRTTLERENILIRGRRQKAIDIVSVQPASESGWGQSPTPANKTVDITVRGLMPAGTYSLQLVRTEGTCRTHEPLDGFDPRYASKQFTWRETLDSDTDPVPLASPAAPTRPDAEVDYLARDYSSFRRLLLDRLSQIMPEWRERNPADMGVTLVELLAWVGDRLAYQQDAVATEAYFGTARKRISVRRHARLVDYQMHEGCNARVLMQLTVSGSIDKPDLKGVQFCTTPAVGFRDLARNSERAGHISHIPGHQVERFYNSVEVFEPVEKPLRPTLLTTNDLINAKEIIELLSYAWQSLQQGDSGLEWLSATFDQPTDSLVKCERLADELVRVWRELRPGFQNEIVKASSKLDKHGVSEHLEQSIVDEFNRLITEERLEENRLDGDLSVNALALAACHAEDADFALANRRFLDRVFCRKLSPVGLGFSLHQAHNEIHFYTWDEDECWLPAGATSATLRDAIPLAATISALVQSKESRGISESQYDGRRRALRLAVGDILVFEEVKGAKTGNTADANPGHRHAVRLTRVCQEVDSVPHEAVNVVEIEWAEEDALPFPLCLSSTTAAPDCCHHTNVSIARGNIVLADHGRSVEEPSSIPGGPEPDDRFLVRGEVRQLDCGDEIRRPVRMMVAEPFRPWLSRPHLTFAQPVIERVPASRLTEQDVHATLPAIELTGIPGNDDGTPRAGDLGKRLATATGTDRLFEDPSDIQTLATLLPPELAYWLEQVMDPAAEGATQFESAMRDWLFALFIPVPVASADSTVTSKELTTLIRLGECTIRSLQQATRWLPKHDLIDSNDADQHFVVELDNQRRALLRFGDDHLGRSPTVGTHFFTQYRVGNGERGNVGAESLSWFIGQAAADGITSVRNPLPATGGQDPQSIREVKLLAPHAYREDQPRAITAQDYKRIVLQDFSGEIQDARASLKAAATGKAAIVAIDPFDSVRNLDDLSDRVHQRLHRVRTIGHHVHVVLAEYLPIELEMNVRLAEGARRSLIRLELNELFSNRVLSEGRLGLFHPDQVTFGNDIHRSRLVAAAQAIAGVDGVDITKLQRVGTAADAPADVLRVGPLQIARLDNNGNRSQGVFRLTLEGGV